MQTPFSPFKAHYTLVTRHADKLAQQAADKALDGRHGTAAGTRQRQGIDNAADRFPHGIESGRVFCNGLHSVVTVQAARGGAITKILQEKGVYPVGGGWGYPGAGA